MKKTITILLAIFAAAICALRFSRHIIPYIQFDDEILHSSQNMVYKDVELQIGNIEYKDSYTIEGENIECSYDCNNKIEFKPSSGNEFMFIDITAVNHSDKTFNLNAIHWMAKAIDEDNKKSYSIDCGFNTIQLNEYYVEVNETKTLTLIFDVPKDKKELEILYYRSTEDKPSLSQLKNKAPDFKIIVEEF